MVDWCLGIAAWLCMASWTKVSIWDSYPVSLPDEDMKEMKSTSVCVLKLL